MVKVITYGTFDVLHYGHIKLLERAKALGDYLVVGITSDDYDKTRGKINNKQSLAERIKSVRDTGLADEIVVEEYEGQKIDDIQRLNIDVFTVGSDWIGKFDYLQEYCQVIYLPRTEGVSSSEVRSEQRKLKLGIWGESVIKEKLIRESRFVNGVEVVEDLDELDYDDFLSKIDAVYILSKPDMHFKDAKRALEKGKHILCESPITLKVAELAELYKIAEQNNCIVMDAIKTAYSTAYERLVLLAKSGKIGEVISVDATCTSLRDGIANEGIDLSKKWNSMSAWAPTALLPIFQILGVDYISKTIITKYLDKDENIDAFSKVEFVYPSAVASIKVAKAAKSEGELIITGSKGYIYVPAPWWKTDYFEVRYENQEDNKRFFYQLDGEGIRNELVTFAKAVENNNNIGYVSKKQSEAIAQILEDFYNRKDLVEI